MMVSGINQGTNNANSAALSSGSNNPQINALETQISKLENSLTSLAQNKDMDSKTKMEKRQQITEQINELKQQISQIKTETRQQKMSGSASDDNTVKDYLPETKNNIKNGSAYTKEGLKQGALIQTPSMEAIISSDNAIHIAKQTNGISTKLSGQAKVLKSEISLDSGRGKVTDSKEAALSNLNNKINTAQKSVFEKLKKGDDDLDKAREKEQEQDDNTNEGN